MKFHPAVVMPPGAVVLDLSGSGWPAPEARWTLGRYDEARGVYTTALFAGGRCVHMGIDLGGPEGTAVHAVGDGAVRAAAVLPAPGDYGHALLVEHSVEGRPIFALYGHLSADSLSWSPVGRALRAGDVLGWLGGEAENGGWPPHLHFQLAWERPPTADLPGAVTLAEREQARLLYPDPRLLLGPVY